MGDNWMTPRRIHLGASELEQLPRHPNWRYESLPGGEMALLVPKPRFGHALLDLEKWRPSGGLKDVGFRTWEVQDPEDLAGLFSLSFEAFEPLAGLSRKDRGLAAREALSEAFSGVEGPVSSASIVALNEGNPVGGALITLLPGGNLDAPGAWRWHEPAPADLELSGAGQPHLTWIFVDPQRQHEGIAAAMLNFCIRKLRTLGYRTLASTFLTGNHASVLWHWRMGFTLMSWPGSPRWRN
jgi:GNAT superfamily N-acetyltransferase